MSQAEQIAFVSGGEELAGYLVRPAGPGPHPGVVVIHEAFGLNDNIRDITRRLAAAGYVALAVDLFTGRNRVVCMCRFFGGLLLNSLGHQGVQDLKAALDYLAAAPDVDRSRLGAIGFCMGGGFAIAWACTDDRLKVIAPFYGTNPRPQAAVARACPIVGSYPGQDFTAGAGRKLARELRQANVTHDITIYAGTKHSFFNDQAPTYDAAAAGDAWKRTLAFFGQQLG